MTFEWDSKKAASNLKKHGLTFEQAITIFDDPDAWITFNAKHSSPEEHRYWLIGKIDGGDVGLVVFTARKGALRVISARRASRRERRNYEANQRVPV